MKTEEWKGRCGCDVGEVPLSYGGYICLSRACRLLVEATGIRYGLKLVIKFGGPRQIVDWEDYVRIWKDNHMNGPDEGWGVAQALCQEFSVNGEDDYIREIFVMEGTGAPQ